MRQSASPAAASRKPGLCMAVAKSSAVCQRATFTNWNSASGERAWCKAASR